MLLSLIFLLEGLTNLILMTKEYLLLWFNLHNTPLLDAYFSFATNVGDGLFYVLLLIPLGIYKLRYAVLGLLSYSLSGLVAQLVKHLIEAPRPYIELNKIMALHYVDGVEVYISNSFPSGHTTSAFSMFLVLALISRRMPLGAVYFFCALSIAVSRMYLVQHYFVDVYFGAVIGLVITLVIYMIIQKKFPVGNNSILDFSSYKKIKDILKKKMSEK